MEAVEQYLPYLMTNERQPNETYTYGERLLGKKFADKTQFLEEDSMGMTYVDNPYAVDQVQTVIDTFKEVGEGWNQATMEIGQPSDCGTDDPPCLRMIDCRLRYGALHFVVYFRSWDLWNGLPANLASLQLLKEYMAAEIRCDDGEMIAASKGLHLYDHSWDLAAMRTYRTKVVDENNE
jgi:thymidylate synthase